MRAVVRVSGPDKSGQNAVPSGHPFRLAVRFARDFARFSGRRGIWCGAAILGSAALESLGLILLIPLLAIAIGALPAGSSLTGIVDALFTLLHLDTHFHRLMFLLALFALLMILRLVVAALRDYLLMQLQIDFVDARRTGVIRHFAAARWDVVSRLQQARVAQLVSADMQRVGFATRLLQETGLAIVMLLAQCLAAFVVSPALALLALLPLAAGAVALSATLRRAHGLGENLTGTNLATMNTIVQFFGGLKLAMSQDLQRGYVGEMEGALRNFADRQLDFLRYQARRQIMFGTLAAVIGIAICAIGLGLLDVPSTLLIGLLIILVRMSGPAITIQQNARQLMQALPAYRALDALEAELRAAASPEHRPGSADRIALPGDIEFDQVGFSYASDAVEGGAALADCSVRIAAGSFVGVSGPSGSGKTTFVDLLVGLLTPDSGEIRIDGGPLRGEAITAWRRQISYIGQDPYLFYDSIRRNLLWANPQASEDELWEALRTAGAQDLVDRMSGGLDTNVGERGMLVSGGERQRLAIARALVRRPRLLILDEATNAIDIAGEQQLIGDLLALDPRPTIVMIAHRNESLALSDQILAFEAGRVFSEQARERPDSGEQRAIRESPTVGDPARS
jgi:ATP-binding cassette subfamily C protein